MQHQLLKISGIIFGIGLIFYAAVRGYFVSPHLPLYLGSLPLPGSNWIPSAIYGAGTVTLLMAFGHRYWSAVLIAGLIGTGFEFMQPNIIPGVFDPDDFAALWIGCILCFVWKPSEQPISSFAYYKRTGKILVVSIGAFSAIATSQNRPLNKSPNEKWEKVPLCSINAKNKFPITISTEDLRKSIGFESSFHSSNLLGKATQNGSTILIQEVNQGIHVLNISDISQPTYKGFVAIPGNTDFELRSNRIIADSFVDLVEIEIQEQGITVHRRWENIFPEKPMQVYLDWTTKSTASDTSSNEIIVGYDSDLAKSVDTEEARLLLSQFDSTNCMFKMPPRKIVVHQGRIVVSSGENFLVLNENDLLTTSSKHGEKSSEVVSQGSSLFLKDDSKVGLWKLDALGNIAFSSKLEETISFVASSEPTDKYYGLMKLKDLKRGDPNLSFSSIASDLSQTTKLLELDGRSSSQGLIFKNRLYLCSHNKNGLVSYGDLDSIAQSTPDNNISDLYCSSLFGSDKYLFLRDKKNLEIFEFTNSSLTRVGRFSFLTGAPQ
jgi:hypothetical protein